MFTVDCVVVLSGPGSVVSFKQPVGVAVSAVGNEVFVLDAGNSRLAVLDGSSLRPRRYVTGVPGLEERGAVGLALTRGGDAARGESVVLVNWRTRQLTQLSTSAAATADDLVIRQVCMAGQYFTCHSDICQKVRCAVTAGSKVMAAQHR